LNEINFDSYFWQEQAHTLLNVAIEQPDTELHLQKHFMAVLSSVWKVKCYVDRCQSMLSFRNGFHSRSLASQSFGKQSGRLTENMDLRILRQSSKLVLAALSDVSEKHQEDPCRVSTQPVARTSVDPVDITLHFLTNPGGYETAFPSLITVSMHEPESHEPESPVQANESHGKTLLAESSCRIAENRLR